MDRNNTNSMRELVADSVISILETTAADGKTYKTQYYNLDAIIAVGYRQPVNSSLHITAIDFYCNLGKKTCDFIMIFLLKTAC